MRMRGIEPPRGRPHTDLNRARLPVPPHPRGAVWPRILATGDAGRVGRMDRSTRKYHRRIVRRLLAVLLPGLLLTPAAGFAAVPDAGPGTRVEVVVGLAAEPAALAGWRHAT